MPRPCTVSHDLSPDTCPWCAWMGIDTPAAAALRVSWGEPSAPVWPAFSLAAVSTIAAGRIPLGAYEAGDLVPGVSDPIPGHDPAVGNHGWAWDHRVRARHVHALRRMIDTPLPPPVIEDSAGIVYLGGGRYWPMVVMGVRMCRQFTDIPITIWHDGEREPVAVGDLAGVADVTIRNIANLDYPIRKRGGWENKTTAIIHSGYRQALFLDADAYLVGDPGTLLKTLSRVGIAIWEDYAENDKTTDWQWSGIGNDLAVPTVQGGHLVVDVVTGWRELVITHFINQHSDYWYKHQYGDQDSWRIALAATGGDYTVIGRAMWHSPAYICGDPLPIIVHRCAAKLWASGAGHFAGHLPGEDRMRKEYERQVLGSGCAAEVFARVYQLGLWGAPESSGGGSSPEQSAGYLELLAGLAQIGGWTTVLDLGCGDGRVTVDLPFAQIAAVDCYRPHLERLSAIYPDIEWLEMDFERDRDGLPRADVCLLKDILHHWPSAMVRSWIEWAAASGKWRWIVCAHDRHQAIDGEECRLGGLRPLSLDMLPLRGLGFRRLMQWIHKEVVVLDCRPTVDPSVLIF